MTTLSRTAFNQKLEARALTVADATAASPELGAAATAADANGDGVVTGAETSALFDEIDFFDNDGHDETIRSTDAAGFTAQGKMADDAISHSILSVRSQNVTLTRAAFKTQLQGREIDVQGAYTQHQKLGDAARAADTNNDGFVHAWEFDKLFSKIDDLDTNGTRSSILSATPIAETEAGAMADAFLTMSTVSTRPAGRISTAMLRTIVPNMSQTRAEQVLPHLNAAMVEAHIDTKNTIAAFVAQLAHESGGFKHFEEFASGAKYEGRLDLGNTQPGDGRRFKGRGPIQLTGRANYRDAGRDLGIDLVSNPTRVSDLDVGFRAAAWFWNSKGLNGPAERGEFVTVTRRINGGTNGLADRRRYYNRALAAL